MAISTSTSAQTAFDDLRSKFNDSTTFYAEFEHSYLDSYTQETTRSLGEFWINPISYKLTSDQQVIVVDSMRSQVYDAHRNRVIISEYEPEDDDFGVLSRMLTQDDDSYTSSEGTLENGNTRIELITDDEFATYIRVEIEVDTMTMPIKITAYDIADNIIVTTFTKGTFFVTDPSIFEFTHPEDAEIVDMRY